MKFYLSSYQLGSNAFELGKLVTGKRRIGVIRNALDFSNDIKRLHEGKEEEFSALSNLNLIPVEIDLRKYFKDGKDDLRQLVESLDGLWVVGGNAFILRRAMRQSGLDSIILSLSINSEFVYAGYSAGVCVMTQTLKGIHLIDDPEVIPKGYDTNILWEGLGVIPFSIVPHYKSDHPESALVDNVVEFLIDNKLPFIALRDGEVYKQ